VGNGTNGGGVVRVAGEGGFGLKGNIKNNLTACAPRLGIAYQVSPKTVVRLGYGRSFDIGVFGSNFGHTVTQNLPVLVNQSLSARDRKSTRLNSSHEWISYAVFCLKKKTKRIKAMKINKNSDTSNIINNS